VWPPVARRPKTFWGRWLTEREDAEARFAEAERHLLDGEHGHNTPDALFAELPVW
jgi:hypothetical protein